MPKLYTVGIVSWRKVRTRVRMAVLDDWEGVATALLDWPNELPGIEVQIFPDLQPEPAALTARLRPFEIVMVMRERTPISREMLEGLPNLRLIVTTGMRNRVLDVEAASDRGVLVCGTQGLQWAAPELTWALILAVCRDVPRADHSMRAGRWEPSLGADLHAATLGIVGAGRLGAQVATVAHAFGMRLLAWSPHLTEERAAAIGAQLVDKRELFRRSDFVSVHMVLSPSTHHLIGAAELAVMKPTAYLINTSRGPIVDQDALLAALREGRLAGAGLDVYDEEPLPAAHPLRGAPRVVLTPHLGYVTRGTFESFYREAAEDVRAYMAGTPIRVLSA